MMMSIISSPFYISAYKGTGYCILTDNESFILIISDFTNKSRTFVVISTQMVLAPEAKAKVLAKLKEVGFEEKHFLELKYEKCAGTEATKAAFLAKL
jgi:hypothetical protein